MKHKIIFLDVDGVLNNHRFLSLNQNSCPELQKYIDNTKVQLLKKIVNQTQAKIVLSSSWRKEFDFSLEPLSKEAAELKFALKNSGLKIWAKTDNNYEKADSIIQWVENNKKIIQKYIIIDDDYISVNKDNEPHLIRTSYYIGLSDKEVTAAINLLN